MLDQSFSTENFRIIFDVENRKGKYLEGISFFRDKTIFNDSRIISEQITDIKKQIRFQYSQLIKNTPQKDEINERITKLKEEKEKLKEEREKKLNLILSKISEKTLSENYSLLIKKGKFFNGKQLYLIEETPEHFFVSKQLQRNIYKTYKVKQSDRKTIISQLKSLLNDGFPKLIIRTDIKGFYENIPQERLLSYIQENNLLSYSSKAVIKDVLNQYWKILIADGVKNESDKRVGVPRGIGVSAYLAELYMRSLDKLILSLDNVTYYARYVDDIVIIITPNHRNEIKTSEDYKSEIADKVLQRLFLELNPEKTHTIDLRNVKAPKEDNLIYLGYDFKFKFTSNEDEEGKIIRLPMKTSMSPNKFERYKMKVELAFQDYLSSKVKYSGFENRINRLLLQRIKFLTNNFRLSRRKSNVLVGVYFSNEFLDNENDLERLDDILSSEIQKIEDTSPIKLIEKLKSQSFKKGFKEKTFLKFHYEPFENRKFLSIWKNI